MAQTLRGHIGQQFNQQLGYIGELQRLEGLTQENIISQRDTSSGLVASQRELALTQAQFQEGAIKGNLRQLEFNKSIQAANTLASRGVSGGIGGVAYASTVFGQSVGYGSKLSSILNQIDQNDVQKRRIVTDYALKLSNIQHTAEEKILNSQKRQARLAYQKEQTKTEREKIDAKFKAQIDTLVNNISAKKFRIERLELQKRNILGIREVKLLDLDVQELSIEDKRQHLDNVTRLTEIFARRESQINRAFYKAGSALNEERLALSTKFAESRFQMDSQIRELRQNYLNERIQDTRERVGLIQEGRDARVGQLEDHRTRYREEIDRLRGTYRSKEAAVLKRERRLAEQRRRERDAEQRRREREAEQRRKEREKVVRHGFGGKVVTRINTRRPR